MINEGDRLALVLEYCNAKDLGDVMEAKDSLSERSARNLLRQLVTTLHELGQRGVCHRDIKMDNLLLHFEKGSENRLSCATLKLSDFGNACAFRGSDTIL